MADPRAIVLYDTGVRVMRLSDANDAALPVIPTPLADLFNTLGVSRLPAEDVVGAVELLDVLDELLQRLGVYP